MWQECLCVYTAFGDSLQLLSEPPVTQHPHAWCTLTLTASLASFYCSLQMHFQDPEGT